MDIRYYLKFWLSFRRKPYINGQLTNIYDLPISISRGEFPGIKLFVFDVDDTIAEHMGVIPTKSLDMLDELMKKGYKVAILTNCGQKRRREISIIFNSRKIYIEPTNLKPSPIGYLKICKQFLIKPENSAMIGEKIGTDMYGAYLAGYKDRVLVKPFSEVYGGKKSNILARIIRSLENFPVKF